MSYRKARTKHDNIKLMTYIQYIQQYWRKKKEKNKKFNVYQRYNRSATLLHGLISHKPAYFVVIILFKYFSLGARGLIKERTKK